MNRNTISVSLICMMLTADHVAWSIIFAAIANSSQFRPLRGRSTLEPGLQHNQ